MNREARTGFIVCSPLVLFMLLSLLRITGVIDWSWWWIAATLWVPLAIITMWAAPAIIFMRIVAKIIGED